MYQTRRQSLLSSSLSQIVSSSPTSSPSGIRRRFGANLSAVPVTSSSFPSVCEPEKQLRAHLKTIPVAPLLNLPPGVRRFWIQPSAPRRNRVLFHFRGRLVRRDTRRPRRFRPSKFGATFPKIRRRNPQIRRQLPESRHHSDVGTD